MRIVIGTVILVLVVLAPAIAGQNASGQNASTAGTRERQERLQQRLEDVKRRLNLTDAQTEQIRPVLASEAEKLRTVLEKRAEGSQSRRNRLTMAREVREIRSEADDALKRILSREQMAELETMRKEWRDDFRRRSGAAR